MARKSRTAVIEAHQQTIAKTYNTAVYARLSIEDSRDNDGDSMENQIHLITQYINERPYLKLCSVYCDNGETGTNFNRPGFEAMMDEVRAGNIKCIVVKDLSRFGRNYIETGEYLEKIFPFMGIRFVSINDGFDNEDGSSTDAMVVNLKNLINDIYSKDISQKIISVLHSKQQNGEYIGGLPLYGYKRSDDDCHRLVVDEETAPVVRDIFRWKSEGVGDALIARRLNETGIPSPIKRRIEKGDVKKTGNCKVFLWRDRTIRMITTNQMYIGNMTQGKTRQALFENVKFQTIPKSEWIIVENTHEPIVDKAVFEKAQEARLKNTKNFCKNSDGSNYIKNEKSLFKGLLVCGTCGSHLIRIKTQGNPVTYSFMCPLKHKSLNKTCTDKTVSEAVLRKIALESIKTKIKIAAKLSEIVEIANKQKSALSDADRIAKRISDMQKELSKLTDIKMSLFESYVNKLLTEDEYIYSKQQYEKRIIEAKQSIESLQKKSVLISETLTPNNKWLQAFLRFVGYDELTSEMIETLIKQIVVRNKDYLDFIWNFESEYEALRDYLKNTPY